MCYYIGIESLVVGALVEMLQRDESQRSLSYATIEKYGNAVVKVLEDQNEEAVLVLSRANTRGFIMDCSDIFHVEDPDSPDGRIVLREGVGPRELARRFAGRMPLAIINALADERSVHALLAA